MSCVEYGRRDVSRAREREANKTEPNSTTEKNGIWLNTRSETVKSIFRCLNALIGSVFFLSLVCLLIPTSETHVDLDEVVVVPWFPNNIFAYSFQLIAIQIKSTTNDDDDDGGDGGHQWKETHTCLSTLKLSIGLVDCRFWMCVFLPWLQFDVRRTDY